MTTPQVASKGNADRLLTPKVGGRVFVRPCEHNNKIENRDNDELADCQFALQSVSYVHVDNVKALL